MQSHWAKYWSRTSDIVRQGVHDVVHMTGADAPSRAARTLYSFNTLEGVKEFITGSDADIGGTSTVNFVLDESVKNNASNGKAASGMFFGNMSLRVQPNKEGKVRGGYAAIQSVQRKSLWGEVTDDISYHDYLALRVRAGGDPATRDAYFVNLRTETFIQADLWQHRLYFRRDDNGWEDIYIPFHNFVRTNHGQIAATRERLTNSKLRSINISLLGGHSNVSGNYELGIDSIRIVNEEDIDRPVTDALNEKAGDVKWDDLP